MRLAGLADVQSLFAVETTTGQPIGVAVYMRADLEHVTVLHLGLSEEYCAGGEREGLQPAAAPDEGDPALLAPGQGRAPPERALRHAASRGVQA